MPEELLERIPFDLETRPLVAIDSTLDLIAAYGAADDIYDSSALKYFCGAVLRSRGIEQRESQDPRIAIFQKEFDYQTQSFIGTCLLRLLTANAQLFERLEFRNKAFALFDTVFATELYPRLNIHPRDQTHEKEQRLRPIVNQVQSSLAATLSSFSDLSLLQRFRQKFMAEINGSFGRAIIIPFLSQELLELRLDSTFKAVTDYLEAPTSRLVELHDHASERLLLYAQDADEYGTKYSKLYLGALVRRLNDLLDEHFAGNPLSKPAVLAVRAQDKKYPFYKAGRTCNVNLIVQNKGVGHAHDVVLSLEEYTGIEVDSPEFYLGTMGSDDRTVQIPVIVKDAGDSVYVQGRITWTNANKQQDSVGFLLELTGQRSNIPWDAIAHEDPYSLEPVSSAEELVGRGEVLRQLMAQALAKSMESAYIYGQKRVGKTSIARTLQSQLQRGNLLDPLVIYLEGGEYVHPDPRITIENLGRSLCEKIQEVDSRLYDLQIPSFDGALAPLSKFLGDALKRLPHIRVLFILDEFDSLPVDLYKPTEIGNAFFLTIRSISGRQPFGFLLVGGERMEFIFASQGDALNKFRPLRIDSFDKGADFADLVRRPLAAWHIEISDLAVEALYDETAGNPYFARLICKELFRIVVETRDSHVTAAEVREAVREVLAMITGASFMHFWKDGILEVSDRAEEISITRRRVLLALADTICTKTPSTLDHIIKGAERYGVSRSSVEETVREFERRGILLLDSGNYHCKVRLFERWLVTRGVAEIITTFIDIDAVLARRSREEEMRVTFRELRQLVQSWGVYQGSHITEEHVRAWLAQFGDNINQRLMFRLLKGIRFYSGDAIRAKLHEAHGIINRQIVRRLEPGKQKRGDILVSYLDTAGKSGGLYAKRYVDENQIYSENVVERGKLATALEDRLNVHALVFVDDFIGTGESGVTYLKKLAADCGDILRKSELKVALFVAICGFHEGKSRLQREATKLKLPININICDPLDDSDRVFSEMSRVYPDPYDRERARALAYEYGYKLEKRAPLGYGGCEAAVVFEDNCPNNSLPVLWAKGAGWEPLFRRL